MISKIQNNNLNNNNLTFKGGLTIPVIKSFALNSTSGIEKVLKDEYGVDANFEGNKYVASCCAAVADIFEYLTKKYNLPFGAKPPSIRMFNEDKLTSAESKDSLAFCITESYQVLKNEPVFELRSLFLNDKYKTLNDLNNLAEQNYMANWNSTNHYLHTYIHEWVHNVHDDMLYRIFGYDGNCPKARMRYNSINGYYHDPNRFVNGVRYLTGDFFQKSYTEEEKAVISLNISRYAAGEYRNNKKVGGNPFELVAEYITKKIVAVLDNNTLTPVKNPFEDINKEEPTIQELFQKAWTGIIN